MAKSSKKFVDHVPSKHLKKVKREAKGDYENPKVSAKKQKVEEKKKKKKEEVIQVDADSSSDSEQPKVKSSAKVAVTNKTVDLSSDSEGSSSDEETRSHVNVPVARKQIVETSDESSSDDDGDDVITVSKKVPSAKNKKAHKQVDTSDESSSDDDDIITVSTKVPLAKKVDSSDDSSSDESSSDDNKVAATKVPGKKTSSSSSSESSSDDETSSDDNVTATKKQVSLANVSATQNKVESSNDTDNSSSDDDSNSDDNVAVTKKKVSANKPRVIAPKTVESSSDGTSSDSDDDDTTAKKVPATLPKKAESSSEDTESDSEDETKERSNVELPAKSKDVSEDVKGKTVAEEKSSDESDDEPPKKKLKDTAIKVTEMKTGKYSSPSENTLKSPTKPKGQTSSNTVFVGNLAYSVEKHDVEKFFKVAGKVVDVRFGMTPDNTFKGFGHVEFDSSEAVQKAVGELNRKLLLGRPVRLDLAKEKGAFTPSTDGKDTQSGQKRGREQWHQLYVRGFNKDGGEDEIRHSLLEHFGSCGDIAKINLPVDQEGGSKGFGYISFRDLEAFNKGLELNGSKMEGKTLYLEEARPREGRDSAPNGGRDSVGRNGVDRRVTLNKNNKGPVVPNRDRAAPNKRRVPATSKPSIVTIATGKKIKFEDDD